LLKIQLLNHRKPATSNGNPAATNMPRRALASLAVNGRVVLVEEGACVGEVVRLPPGLVVGFGTPDGQCPVEC
jgi:hypothetical protein